MTNKQPEALRLAEHLERFRSFPDDLAAAQELRRQHARIVELEASLQDALSHMEVDWEMIDSEWGPCGLTLEQAVENGKHGTEAIKSARKALRNGITQEKQG